MSKRAWFLMGAMISPFLLAVGAFVLAVLSQPPSRKKDMVECTTCGVSVPWQHESMHNVIIHNSENEK